MPKEVIDGDHVEYLALGRGHNDNGTIAMITLRLNPEESLQPSNLLLTLDEVLRLRDDLNFEFGQDEFPEKDRQCLDE